MEALLLTLVIFGTLVGLGFYLRSMAHETEPPPGLTEDQIKREWRKLGFFCELDDQTRTWTLTGSRAGLLFFPDLLFGYVADPENARDGDEKHYGPYGSLDIMTLPHAGFGGNAIRGSLIDLARLATLVETKLATAQPGEQIKIREEFAGDSPYSLVLDIRADGFDPASADRERLGAARERRDTPDNKNQQTI
jgi:hypothetical protein